jgi:chromosome segregation ATPase
MEGAPIDLILNVVILVLLGLTIVYAARLSLQLRRLRDSKSDLDKVVKDLIKNLDRADRSIMGLKEAAREAGGDLQSAIDRAISISDELEVINDSGNRLASRLEGLMDHARPMVSGNAAPKAPPQPQKQQPQQQQAAALADSQTNYAQHLRKLDPSDEKITRNTFAIRDADVERGIDPLENKDVLEDDAAQGLYSEAERDLFRAMKGKTKR